MKKKKIILVLSGHDPSGGAGIVADIETANYFNFHCISILTCTTIQNTEKVYKINEMPNNYIYESFKKIIKEFEINVVKIGLIPSIKCSKEILKIIGDKRLKGVPIIIDPIIKSGSNNFLTTENNIKFMIKNIYSKAELITPNIYEYKIIENLSNNIKKHHFKNIIITNYKINKKSITLKLLKKNNIKVKIFKTRKFNGIFHGTGCTLSTAIACNIAASNNLEISIQKSLDYLVNTIKFSNLSGNKQSLLNRKH